MPNPFVKLWKYLTASANAQIDQRADPKIQIAQAIEAEQQRHQALANQAAAVLGNQRQLEMRLNRQLGEVEKLQGSARQALVLADKTRAGGDANKAAEYENAAQAFATQLVAAEQAMEDLKRSHDEALQAAEQARGAVEQSRMRLQTTLAERTKLMSQLEQAKMQEHVASSLRQVNELSAPGNTPSLSEVRDKIEARYANALGQAELAQTSVEGRMLEVQKATLDVAGASRLDQIRAAMSGGTPAVEGSQPAAAIEQGTPPVQQSATEQREAQPAERPDQQEKAPPAPRPSQARGGTLQEGRGPGPPARASAVEGHRLGPVGLTGAGLRVDRGAGRLAVRAPPRHPLLRGRPLLAEQDRRAAPQAGLAAAAEHPVVAAAPRIAGGVLLRVVQVGPHERAGALDERRQAFDVGDPRPGMDAEQEQRLDLVKIADPGEVALIEDRDADLFVGVLAQPAQRLVEIPVRAQDIGTEVADEPVLLGRRDEVDVVQPVSDALPVVGREDQTDVVGRAAVPGGPGAVDVPAAVHPEVRAQRPVVGQPDQQVLPSGHDLADGDAGQVEGRQLGDAELAAAQAAAGQRGVHPLRGQPHGVSLGHSTMIPVGGLSRCMLGSARIFRSV
jgi:phage shock protein A